MKRKRVIINITDTMLKEATPGSCNDCPIALAILEQLQRTGHVNVQASYIQVVSDGKLLMAIPGKKAKRFIETFDNEATKKTLKPTKLALTFKVTDISNNQLRVLQ